MRGIKIQRNVSYKQNAMPILSKKTKNRRKGSCLNKITFEAGVIAKGGSKVPNTTLESWLTANRAEIIERPLDLATSTVLRNLKNIHAKA